MGILINHIFNDNQVIIKKSSDCFKFDGKFITINNNGNEELHLFPCAYQHSEKWRELKANYAEATIISAGFCEFDRYDAEDNLDCIPLIAKGYSYSLNSPPARTEDTKIIHEYIKNIKKNA